MAAVDGKELLARLVAYVDRRHPRFGSHVMRARFGGLRVREPGGVLVTSVLVGGAGLGVAVRRAVAQLSGGRVRPGAVPSMVLGPAALWGALWRWDATVWRRRHVTLVLDRPAPDLDRMVDELAAKGIVVRRWDGPRAVGGAATGLTCRLRDLRAVNAHLDAAG